MLFRSTLTERQKFWIFLAICIYVPGIFRASSQMMVDDFEWGWIVLYPIMSTGLLCPVLFLAYLFRFFFL